ncbi:MAG: hypothetical protein H6Q58_832 [Firmicutes bacterium]|nr:hypothetical protein [Bacillota bacterium]
MFKTAGSIFGIIANVLMIVLAGFYIDLCCFMGYTSAPSVIFISGAISTLMSYIINPITYKWALIEGIIWFTLPILWFGFPIQIGLMVPIASVSIPKFIGAVLGYRIRKLRKENRIDATEQNRIKRKWYSNWRGKG